jgi:hypothetical protein
MKNWGVILVPRRYAIAQQIGSLKIRYFKLDFVVKPLC